MSKASQLITLLGAVSERGEYVAERLREDLAKAWANGEHNVVKRKLDPGEFHTVNEKIAYDTQSKGTTIEKAVNYFAECCGIFQDLSKALDTAPDADEAAKIWDGWDKVCNPTTYMTSHSLTRCQDLEKYWDFVKDLTTKLKEDGIRRYVGAQFKTIFESTIQAFEVCIRKSSLELDF